MRSAADHRYSLSDRGRARNRRYNSTEKGKATTRRFRQSALLKRLLDPEYAAKRRSVTTALRLERGAIYNANRRAVRSFARAALPYVTNGDAAVLILRAMKGAVR